MACGPGHFAARKHSGDSRIFPHHPCGNRGAAFGLFADSPSEWKITALVLFSIVALAIVSVLLWRNSHSMQSTGIGLALILEAR